MKFSFCDHDYGFSGLPTLASDDSTLDSNIVIGHQPLERVPFFFYVYTEEDYENCGEPSINLSFPTLEKLEATLGLMGFAIDKDQAYSDFKEYISA